MTVDDTNKYIKLRLAMKLISRFIKDFGWILLISANAIIIQELLVAEHPMRWVKRPISGFFFAVHESLTPYHSPYYPMPIGIACFIVFFVSLRLFRSKTLLFLFSWALVALNNYSVIESVKDKSSEATYELNESLLYDGAITPFGYLVINIGPEGFLSIFATITLIGAHINRLPNFLLKIFKFLERL